MTQARVCCYKLHNKPLEHATKDRIIIQTPAVTVNPSGVQNFMKIAVDNIQQKTAYLSRKLAVIKYSVFIHN